MIDIKNITPEWLTNKLSTLGIKQIDMAHDLSMSRGWLSSHLNGSKTMSKMAKLLYYYYLKYKEVVKEK